MVSANGSVTISAKASAMAVLPIQILIYPIKYHDYPKLMHKNPKYYISIMSYTVLQLHRLFKFTYCILAFTNKFFCWLEFVTFL